jgi:ADP-ribose pyrophosphatase
VANIPKEAPEVNPSVPKQDLTEHLVSSEIVYDGVMLRVFKDTVRLPSGRLAPREYIRHPGAVTIIPLLASGEVVMERQFRYPLARDFYEFPAGKIDPGEEPLVTGKRELLEETGYSAEIWTHLTTIHPVIGYADERIEIYLAENLSAAPARLDDGEFLEVFALPVATAVEWVESGRITDVKTVIGVFWLEKLLAKRAPR